MSGQHGEHRLRAQSLRTSAVALLHVAQLSSFGIAMHLIGCQEKKKQTLDEFYTEVTRSENPVSREIGRVMLSLIALACELYHISNGFSG